MTAWDIAQQMTIRDSALYCSIQPWEVVTPVKKDEREGRGGSLVELVNYFNRVVLLVSQCILSFEKLEQRSKVMSLWVRVATHCLEINNYNGAMEVFAGLNQLAVFRLKHTIAAMSDEDKKRMQKLDELLAPHAGYIKLKTAVSTSAPPCVPYMGLYISDMTYILDGMPSKLESGMYNYQKFQTCANLVQQVRLFQDVKYTFEDIAPVQAFLEGFTALTEEELYKTSLECEKRGGGKS
eukprot:CAMPEP_0201513038 /NCGR_PEP_ID=MMETSP0161_2-20130828/5174_1 /ASSEMBLY_ACC=CAM_ASM_000251 /TAXON_ID=180227 /ORGANISM="Neoparamoeba aestuarina, Strain SoJaBio B1-5/56/2" /LENGTH=237 /DNA_ID=CAMNT_0047909103 /DNA_START=286 /DNA_END=999 /DNA_ORIENTATION=+